MIIFLGFRRGTLLTQCSPYVRCTPLARTGAEHRQSERQLTIATRLGNNFDRGLSCCHSQLTVCQSAAAMVGHHRIADRSFLRTFYESPYEDSTMPRDGKYYPKKYAKNHYSLNIRIIAARRLKDVQMARLMMDVATLIFLPTGMSMPCPPFVQACGLVSHDNHRVDLLRCKFHGQVGTQDPYCKVSIRGTKGWSQFRTRTINNGDKGSKGSAATWNQKFCFTKLVEKTVRCRSLMIFVSTAIAWSTARFVMCGSVASRRARRRAPMSRTTVRTHTTAAPRTKPRQK